MIEVELQSLPTDRLSRDAIRKDWERIKSMVNVEDIINSLPHVAGVLNANMQLVYSNKLLLEMLGITTLDAALGLRYGELFNCVNVVDDHSRCGKNSSCHHCEALKIVDDSLTKDAKIEKECTFNIWDNGVQQTLHFHISATPLRVDGMTLTILSINDLSVEKQKENLERIFFHDIINTAGGLDCFLEFLKECDDPTMLKEHLEVASEISDVLIGEIVGHRDLIAAEKNELRTKFTQIDTLKFVNQVVNQMIHHKISDNKKIKLIENLPELTFFSDLRLLKRVLVNMLKNAIEATPHDSQAEIGYTHSTEDDTIAFWTHNPTYMPQKIQENLFVRSFTTKQHGKGLGTYSMKLLGEKYLRGKVYFESTQEEGTKFFITLPVHGISAI